MNRSHAPVLQVQGLTKRFGETRPRSWTAWMGRRKGHAVQAVSDVSFAVEAGTMVGIVGESGSGKTTLGRMLLRLVEPTRGRVLLHGRDVFAMKPDEVMAHVRPKVRMIFQHPDAVLNPGYTVGTALAKSIALHSAAGEDIPPRVAELLVRVGLDPSFCDKYPDELSGGEKRRIGICRALATDPDVIVADEPLSGLDVLLQERILSLLQTEQQRRGFALLLISHDLDRVNQVCDRVLVMYGGRLMEDITLRKGGRPAHEQFMHPYSTMLQEAAALRGDNAFDLPEVVETGIDALDAEGRIESAEVREIGCPFRFSCPLRAALGGPGICETTIPPALEVSAGHRVACHFAGERVREGASPMRRAPVNAPLALERARIDG